MSDRVPTMAHLFGGPHDGETVELQWVGKDLRFPFDYKHGEGLYVFAGRAAEHADHDFIFRWKASRLHVGWSGVNGRDEPRIWCLDCGQGDTKLYSDEPGIDAARCWCCTQPLVAIALQNLREPDDS